MGTHPSTVDRSGVIPRMYVRVLLLSLAAGLAAGSLSDVPRKIMDTMKKYNLLEKCWGKKNMIGYSLGQHKASEHCKQLSPIHSSGFQTLPQPIGINPWEHTKPWGNTRPSQGDSEILSKLAELLMPKLRRYRRQSGGGLINADESDLQDFLRDIADFREGMASKISNLTCVLTQMNMLDANMQPNIYQYTTGVWNDLDMSEENIAIQDPAWVQKMKDGYQDCYDLAMAWPQKSLQRNELTKKYGRQMVFFKCANKIETINCAKFCVNEALELWYGKDDGSVDWSQYGLPRDKYDAAAMSMLVLHDAATPEEEFVSDFFWGQDHM